MKKKTCSRCSLVLAISNFSIRKDSRIGYRSACKKCTRSAQTATRATEQGKLAKKISDKKYYSKPEVKLKMKLYRKKYYHANIDKERAKNKKLPTRYSILLYKSKRTTNIKFEKYELLIKRGCFYCLQDLDQLSGISLDRIDNSKGYSEDNVLPCCGDCNKLRGNRTSVQETLKMIILLQTERDVLDVWGISDRLLR